MMVDFLGARIAGSSDSEINCCDELGCIYLAMRTYDAWNTDFIV